MAASDSSDRQSGRFLPSIGNQVDSSWDERGISVKTEDNAAENRPVQGGRRTFHSIRSFFSSNRSSRRSRNDKTKQRETNLPSLAPPSTSPSNSKLETNPARQQEKQLLNVNSRTRTSSLREPDKRELLSVEANLRCMTGESRSAPPSRCGSSLSTSTSSSSSGSSLHDGSNLAEESPTTARVYSSNSTKRNKLGARAPVEIKVECDQESDGKPNRVNLGKSLSTGTDSMEKGEEKQEEEVVTMFKNSRDLKDAFKKAKAAKEYSSLLKFLTTTFNSFSTLRKVFKAKDYEKKCGINANFVNGAYDIIMALPGSDHRKAILTSIINCLLNNIKNKLDDEDLIGYLILLQNPQFDSCSSYVIFSHLLRQVSSLSDRQHQTLVGWIEWLPATNFKALINRLKEFISISLFPTKEDGLPPSEKMRFWVPSAVKVLALLNAANWVNNRPIVSYRYMYIDVLENINLAKEYETWQSRSGFFSFCQYPFLLTLRAKRSILEKDSEAQMIEIARRSLLEGVQKREAPAIGMFFLNLRVRRRNLMEDSLNEITRKRQDLKKKLKVTFVGEPGLDLGGLTKEWFMLLVRKVFRPEYGMFCYDDKASCYWFTNVTVNDLSEFYLVGVLMGLAVYNSTILDIRFPLCCYKKLLSPGVVPADPNVAVGVTKLELSDLKEVMPELARGLQELLNYDGNVEEDMCQTFQVSTTVFGSVITENLKENGDSIPVTIENRAEYVDLYVDYILNRSIYRQFTAFYRGFHHVCASNALLLLRPEEVEMLVCGNPDFDMRALCKVTTYDGFSKKDLTIRYFWETVGHFSSSLKRKLLRFCTGSDRIPVGGLAEMDFKITRIPNARDEMLPMAHTCFNQLCLPPYTSKSILKTKLIIAISNSEGFGIE